MRNLPNKSGVCSGGADGPPDPDLTDFVCLLFLLLAHAWFTPRDAAAQSPLHKLPPPRDANSFARTIPSSSTASPSLLAEWPAEVLSQADGKEAILLTRPGKGDRVPGIWLKGRGQAALVVAQDGAAAARKSPEVAQLVAAGRPVLMIDAFQTGSAVAPRDRSGKFFTTFNKTDDANRVQDILTALAGVKLAGVKLAGVNREAASTPNTELIGIGKAGVWCLFPAAVAGQPVQLKADLSGFNGTDRDYLDRFFVPGIQRAGGLQAARFLAGN